MATEVRDAMTPSPTSVPFSTTVADAASLMVAEDVGSLPVVVESRLVGVITDRDIVRRVVAEGRDPTTTAVGEVATSEPVVVGPDSGLAEALAMMASHKVRRLPVVEEGSLVGILAQADVAREAGPKDTGDVVAEISEPSGSDRS